MRFFGYGIAVFVWLAGLNSACASGTGFAAASWQVTDAALYCDKPVHSNEEPVISTAVHPIWQVDIQRLHLGHIEDDLSLTAFLPAVSLPDESNNHPALASTDSIGFQLENGWSLGFTYETIDTSLKLGSAVEESSIGPVYEGPMFVATLKFR